MDRRLAMETTVGQAGREEEDPSLGARQNDYLLERRAVLGRQCAFRVHDG